VFKKSLKISFIFLLIFLFFVGCLEVFTLLLYKFDRWKNSDYISSFNGHLNSTSSLNFLRQKGLDKKLTPIYAPIGNHKNPWLTLMSCSPALKKKSSRRLFENLYKAEIDQFSYPSYNQNKFNFRPSTFWTNGTCNSSFYNVDDQGIRKTVNTQSIDKNNSHEVFIFGGSTTFGTGVNDDETIPSYLSKLLNENDESIHYNVTNFGTSAFILDQDLNLFLNQLKNGIIPHTVIFYGGFNDIISGLVEPGINGWNLKSRSIEQKLNTKTHEEVSCRFLNNSIYLAEHILEKLKDRGLIERVSGTQKLSSEIKFLNQINDLYSLQENSSEKFINYYRNTLEIIKNICVIKKINCFFFWQPCLLFTNKELDIFEKNIVDNDALIAFGSFNSSIGREMDTKIKDVYKKLLSSNAFDNKIWHSLINIFDDINESIFIDCIHLGPAGNKLVSKEIYNSIHPKIKK